jgi:hypothetical protein
VQNIQLHLAGEQGIVISSCWVFCNIPYATRDRLDVIFDEVFGAAVCSIVKPRRSDVAKVADETASDEVDDINNISILLGLPEGHETLFDESPIVVLADRI